MAESVPKTNQETAPMERPDPKDKNAFMAWMRSQIKRKSVGSRTVKTNDFELDNAIATKGSRKWKKKLSEHIKCVVVSVKQAYPDRDKAKVYIVGFLSDSNRFSFETLRDSPFVRPSMQNPGMYRFKKMGELFRYKKIDSRTIMLVCLENFSRYDFFPYFLNLVANITDCTSKTINIPRLLVMLDNEFNIYGSLHKKRRTYEYVMKLDRHLICQRLYKAYDFIAESGVCPWITGLEVRRNMHLARRAKYGIILAELSMLIAMIKSYRQLEKELKKELRSGKQQRQQQQQESQSLAEEIQAKEEDD